MEKVKILLVDDRAENLVSLCAVLDDPAYDLVLAESGEVALRRLLKEEFALILMDVQMPELDGFQTARLIRMRERCRNVPIIFVTALSREEPFVYEGYGTGAVDYILKPFDPKILCSKVAVFADLYRKSRQIERDALLLREKEIAERELVSLRREQEANQKYRDLVDGITDGVVWTADPASGRVTFISPQAEQVTGFTAQDWSRNRRLYIRQMVRNERRAVLAQMILLLRAGGDVTVEHRFLRRDGRSIWLKTSIRLTRTLAGAELRGLSTDVTRLKQAEEEAVAAVQVRDDFLSIASHELKTPLTALRLQLQLMRRELAKAPSVESLRDRAANVSEMSLRQLDRLGRLVDELLDVSRIRSGQMSLQKERMNLSELVTDLTARMSEEFKKGENTVHLQVDPGIFGSCDRMRAEQVVLNLLTNAIKYGHGKPIEIRLWKEGTTAKLSVRDHGIGIKREAQERIFKRFERAVSGTQYSGLGLGLYIVSQILRAHDGRISVRSNLGQGSEFTVELPCIEVFEPMEGLTQGSPLETLSAQG